MKVLVYLKSDHPANRICIGEVISSEPSNWHPKIWQIVTESEVYQFNLDDISYIRQIKDVLFQWEPPGIHGTDDAGD